MCRNRLHFWGIPFDILDDPDRLNDFFDKCLDNSMRIKEGTPPYSFRFTDSVTGHDGRQDNKQQQKEEAK